MTTSSELHLAAGSTGRGNYETIIDPGARDDWVHTGLRVLALTPGSSEIVTADGVEAMIVPLNGGCQVAVDGRDPHAARPRGRLRRSDRRAVRPRRLPARRSPRRRAGASRSRRPWPPGTTRSR